MISIIVAVAGEKRVIGKKGGLPWYIPEELKRFKQITMGHPIIMGRRTHESIGKPLPGRTNIVVTRGKDTLRLCSGQEGESEIIIANSLEEALQQAMLAQGHDEIFVIGGEAIYKQALPLADKLYLTYIDKEIEGDVFFPDYSEFKKVLSDSDWQYHEDLKYKFFELAKKI